VQEVEPIQIGNEFQIREDKIRPLPLRKHSAGRYSAKQN